MLMIDSTTEYQTRKILSDMDDIAVRLSLVIDGLEDCDNEWECEKRKQCEALLEDLRDASYSIGHTLRGFSIVY